MTTLERMVAAVRRMPEVILVFRRRAGLTVREAAWRAGVPVDRWRLYESGAVLPEGEELHTLAEAVETDLETLARYAWTLIVVEELAGPGNEIPDANELAPKLRDLATRHDRLVTEMVVTFELARTRLAYEKGLKRLVHAVGGEPADLFTERAPGEPK